MNIAKLNMGCIMQPSHNLMDFREAWRQESYVWTGRSHAYLIINEIDEPPEPCLR